MQDPSGASTAGWMDGVRHDCELLLLGRSVPQLLLQLRRPVWPRGGQPPPDRPRLFVGHVLGEFAGLHTPAADRGDPEGYPGQRRGLPVRPHQPGRPHHEDPARLAPRAADAARAPGAPDAQEAARAPLLVLVPEPAWRARHQLRRWPHAGRPFPGVRLVPLRGPARQLRGDVGGSPLGRHGRRDLAAREGTFRAVVPRHVLRADGVHHRRLRRHVGHDHGGDRVRCFHDGRRCSGPQYHHQPRHHHRDDCGPHRAVRPAEAGAG
mmetsp:Transcript_73510/g.191870  ORF Transcript_73510/g.191870 Transcript_73510/m.191870 type:complete len:265 (-) Transcript_73510:1045-1839(-)